MSKYSCISFLVMIMAQHVPSVETDADAQPGVTKRLQEYEFAGVNALAVSPNGKRVATAGLGVGLWSVKTGRHVRWLVDHRPGVFDNRQLGDGVVTAVVFSPDGRNVISAGTDGTVRVADMETGKTSLVLKTTQAQVSSGPCPLFSVAVSSDGSLIAAGGYHGGVEIWNARTGKLIDTFGGIKATPHTKKTSTAKIGHSRVGWELGRVVIGVAAGTANPVWTLHFSPDKKMLAASIGYAGAGRVWDLSQKRPHRHVSNGSPGAFLSDGRLFTSKNDSVAIWDTVAWKQRSVIKGVTSPLTVLRRKSGTFLAASTPEGTIKLIALPSGKVVSTYRLRLPAKSVSAIAAARDIIALASDDGRVSLWNVPKSLKTK